QLEERPDAVSDRWGPALEGAAPRMLPPGTALAEVFDAHDGELLLLGEPGAGKTTLLLRLAATLIERAQRDGSLPIPVVFPLAPWAAHRGPLEAWLVEELSLRYDVPRRLAREWVAQDEVLPLLDGLDELPARLRGACVTAIDAFRSSREGGFLGLVVTSRRAEYEALGVRLGVTGAVLVHPLGPDEVERFLAGAGGQLDGVRAALRADATLRQLATSPLSLSVMALAYQGAPAAALPAEGSLEARRTQLFGTYVQRMLRRRRAGAAAGYPEEETRRRLTWLAQALTRQAQTVLYLENLQPDWLTGAAQRRRYARLDRLGAGLLGALLMGVPLGTLFGAPAGPSGAALGALAGGLAGGALSGLLGGAGVGGGALRSAAGGAARGATPAGETGAAAGAERGGVRGAVLGMLSTAGAAWLAVAVWVGLSGRAGGAGLFGGLAGEASEQLSDALAGMGVLGLIFGLAGGLAGYQAGGPGLGPRRITVVETLRWSAARGRRAAVRGVVLPTVAVTGLALALLVGTLLAGGPATGLPGELRDPRALFLFVMLFAALMGVAVGLPFGVVAGLLFGVIGGLEPGEVETSVRPNQGIRRSARTALRAVGVALAGVLAVGLLLTLAGALVGQLGGLLAGAGVGEPGEVTLRVLARLGGWLIFGLPLALAAGLVYGGYACLSHGALRLVLWRTGALPLDCVPFLDYGVKRVLLRRVGGGYMFVHRL
ncbi:MAG TPA: NACHT domain-containing protein, partial [Chloroflexota bacterium]|nr:NACHT domain-containing protein [Chloroflexota bacterium]